jgi:2,4-dienoyl-CoA reductase (NADPH2)
MRHVKQIGSCKYLEVNDEGLVIETKGVKKTLPVDTVVVCAGQVSELSLYKSLMSAASTFPKPPRLFLIGGSQEAGELDAKRAIDQGTR